MLWAQSTTQNYAVSGWCHTYNKGHKYSSRLAYKKYHGDQNHQAHVINEFSLLTYNLQCRLWYSLCLFPQWAYRRRGPVVSSACCPCWAAPSWDSCISAASTKCCPSSPSLSASRPVSLCFTLSPLPYLVSDHICPLPCEWLHLSVTLWLHLSVTCEWLHLSVTLWLHLSITLWVTTSVRYLVSEYICPLPCDYICPLPCEWLNLSVTLWLHLSVTLRVTTSDRYLVSDYICPLNCDNICPLHEHSGGTPCCGFVCFVLLVHPICIATQRFVSVFVTLVRPASVLMVYGVSGDPNVS